MRLTLARSATLRAGVPPAGRVSRTIGAACTVAAPLFPGGVDVNVRLEELGVAAPIRFGAQQSQIRILQQCLGVRTIIGVQTYPGSL